MTSPDTPRPDQLPFDASITRRTVLQASAIATAAGLVVKGGTGSAAAAAPVSTGQTIAKAFAEPSSAYRAGFRWWWPHGLVDPVEIAREVDQVADAGFGLLEIADVHHSVSSSTPLDPAGHGWGTAPWREAVESALTRAKQRGLRIDLTIGPSWPAATPTVTPDSDGAAHELAHGVATVAAGATYDAELPEPVVHAAGGVTRKTLVRTQVAQVTARPTNQPVVLDPASVQDVTDLVSGTHLTWTAPATGEWVVIAYWQRGSGQKPEAGPHTTPDSYVVDHFSRAGSEAVFAFWDEAVLTPSIRALLEGIEGNVFEDSLEMETDATLWTPNLLEEFRDRAGYDLVPYLPCIVQVDEKYAFVFDATTSGRVRFDVGEVLGQLYFDEHLRPIQQWARGFGFGLRVQPYGRDMDSVAEAAVLDVPEGESLGFKNLDDYRILASGRDIGGKSILSCESACYAGGAYNTTWQKALGTVGSIMAGGVSQNVFHGYPYRDVPDVQWPGFAAFSPYQGAPGYGEAWGPRMPSWRHVRPIADYLGRTQMVLRSGRPRVDVAVFRQRGSASTGIGAGYFTNDGIPIGWTHGFLTAAVMETVPPTVRDGRLYPDGPAYKVVVLAGDRFASQEKTIPVGAAKTLLSLAQQGLKVVVVGDWSAARGTGLSTSEEDAQVRAAVAELRALPNVTTVADDASIPTGLAALGVTRTVEHATSTLMHVHRQEPLVDYFYVANARHAENRRINRVEQDVVFRCSVPEAVPYAMDAWTGELTRVAQYAQDGDRFTIRVGLNPGETTLIAIGASDWYAGGAPGAKHAVATTADAVRFDGPNLVVRSAAGGTVETTLSNGRFVRTPVAPAPAAPTVGTWTLEVEDWTPGAQPWQTEVTTRTVELTSLVAWTQIPGLADVSGIGRYATTVTAPDDWTADAGAWLDLGTTFDTVRVTLNGERLPAVSPLVTKLDLGNRLRPGANRLVVEVTTTLFNRLRTTHASVFGSSTRQNYGLLGPVKVVPYREATL